MSNITIHEIFKDLAPSITRRRLVIECIHNQNFDDEKIKNYMIELSNVMNMTIVTMPISNNLEEYGYSAYMSWKESGMHVYTWDETNKRPNFMSIDIYTCKNFSIEDVISFTIKYFNENITEITWRI
tara:strand:+ start:1490 stop:1870 length:381 start_codon:yes stop_codon:yes gene_type:complete